jgi:hypothetical protein
MASELKPRFSLGVAKRDDKAVALLRHGVFAAAAIFYEFTQVEEHASQA